MPTPEPSSLTRIFTYVIFSIIKFSYRVPALSRLPRPARIRNFILASGCLVLSLLLGGAALAAGAAPARDDGPVLRLTGLTAQPLRLTLADLSRLASVRMMHQEVTRDGAYHGTYWLQGAPLRDLLALAQVDKPEGAFAKRGNLALRVTSRSGRQVALSWGEVFLHNPAEVILAVSAQPVTPREKGAARRVGLPKLVLGSDKTSDRALEEVVSIEVMEALPAPSGPRSQAAPAPTLTIQGPDGQKHLLDKLPALPRATVQARQVGTNMGFYGSHRFTGAPLADLLPKLGLKGGPNTVYLVSAPDHYYSLISWGELFLGPLGRRILVADRRDGKPLGKDGRFKVVLPDDLWSERWVRSASLVRAVELKPRARLYVIGMGCGDSKLLTLEALDYLNRADILVAPADIQKRFAPFLAGKPVLFDPMAYKKAGHPDHEHQAKAAALIQAELDRGKRVAVLDWGDPTIYGSWRWLAGHFSEDSIHIVPGLSAFNVGSAALGRDVTCRGAVAISDPYTLRRDPGLAKDLAAKGATLVIFMGLPQFDQVMAEVTKAYGPTAPAALVLYAGYQAKQRVARGTLAQIIKATQGNREKWLGVIFVGPCLD